MATFVPSQHIELPPKATLGKSVDYQDDSPVPKLLAVSYSYPPKQEPRAIQVSRLLKHLKASTVLVCEGDNEGRTDSAGLGDMESFLDETLRVPLTTSTGRDLLNRLSSRIYLPVWSRTPDQLGPWKKPVFKTIDHFMRTHKYRPDVLVTFAFPLVDNIIGLELKRRLKLPWLAHFSDPWVDSPFRTDDPLTRALNARLEQHVIERADRLVFTSSETADLVMQKYQPELHSKVRIVPHAYEPQLFQNGSNHNGGRLIIRYLGDLYQSRTPQPLFKALEILSQTEPELLRRFCFEIVGDVHELNLEQMGLSRLPDGLVVFRPRVNYSESLSMMTSASGLMVIDAPVEKNTESVFLPSKLIEYVGADRPIIGLTPPGTAAYLISRLGGWVADPGSAEEVAHVVRQYLSFVWDKRHDLDNGWGRSEVREEFEAEVVANRFYDVLMELV
jgi:glycosyltransferase involved in cell wall biosynthesis